MKARHLLASLMCIAVAGTGCAGGGTGGTAAANGGNGGGGNAGNLRSEVDTSACKELPADLVTAVSAKLTNILGGYGYKPVLASMERCVESAVAGRVL